MVRRIKKKCNGCLEDKFLRDFYKRKDTPDGYRSDCKLCYKEKSNNRWFNDSDFRERGKYRSKKHSIKKNYNLTVEEYDYLLSKKCAICGLDSDVLDHDHTSGKVLEALCMPCNTGIGNLKEDIDLLNNAIEYIRKHNKISKRDI